MFILTGYIDAVGGELGQSKHQKLPMANKGTISKSHLKTNSICDVFKQQNPPLFSQTYLSTSGETLDGCSGDSNHKSDSTASKMSGYIYANDEKREVLSTNFQKQKTVYSESFPGATKTQSLANVNCPNAEMLTVTYPNGDIYSSIYMECGAYLVSMEAENDLASHLVTLAQALASLSPARKK